MVNGEAIVAQVRQGAWPQHWQVFRARTSYFLRQVFFMALLLVIAVVGIVYLLGHPNEVFTIDYVGSSDGTIDPGAFSIWRVVDFALLALFLVGFAAYAVLMLVQLTGASEQVLVLFPEGFVVKNGPTRAFAFAQIRTISATRYRGVLNIRVVAVDGRSFRVRLDGRFGSTKQLGQRILTARSQFAAAAPRPPVPRGA